jgi:protein N-terminal methyltransferase
VKIEARPLHSETKTTFIIMSDRETPEVEGLDAAIDQQAALDYWSSVSADDSGVLGGYPQVSRIDLQGSSNFLAKLRRKSTVYSEKRRLSNVADCGAGIGRVTKGLLAKVASKVDIIEPVVKLTDVIIKGDDFKELREKGIIGDVYNVGLEGWKPDKRYDLIWNQWCLGQLTDAQVVDYLTRIKDHIQPNGWIVVKENMSSDINGQDIFDETDSSITRSDEKFRGFFEKAGLRILATESQRGFPKELFSVREYALQPISK